jgi:hypothetical protein
VAGRRLDDVDPDRAGLDARHLAVRVDVDCAHALGADEERVLERSERRCRVAGALRRHAQVVGRCELHERDDVGCAPGQADGGGSLVDREVPRSAGLVPAGVAGPDDHARQVFGDGELGVGGAER